MNGQRLGYVRVSSVDQNLERQLDNIQLDKMFEEKVSGASKDRPMLTALIDYARDGDEVLVHSLDRLGRNLDDLNQIVKKLNQKGVSIHFLKEGLIFKPNINNPVNTLFFHIMGAVAEFERERIRSRQAEGIAIAKRKGLYKGRRPALSIDEVKRLHERLFNKDFNSMSELAKDFGISVPTLYRYAALKK